MFSSTDDFPADCDPTTTCVGQHVLAVQQIREALDGYFVLLNECMGSLAEHTI